MDEEIQGYRCENERCKHVSTIHRIQKILHAPDVLLIQLITFKMNGKKDSSIVRYNEIMDITPHAANPDEGRLLYRLRAVVAHSGTEHFGHYICLAKAPDGDWYAYDDDHKRQTTVNTAINLDGGSAGGFTPYLLFYERYYEANMAARL
jgi:ubiquitin carboxyl-terminal hydrolase 36/42